MLFDEIVDKAVAAAIGWAAKKGEIMKTFALILIGILGLAAVAQADVYIKQESKRGAFSGQPEKTIVQEIWLGKDKMATIAPDSTTIIDMGLKKFLSIHHQTKSYVEAAFPVDMSKIMPEQMAQMMKNMIDGMTISVKPNGQTKKIGQWNTAGYDGNIKMMGMDMKMVFWASTDVPFDWKSYANMYTEMQKVQLNVGEKFIEEFRKIKGYPVATETSMMGMDLKMTVLEIANKDPGAKVFSVPTGYTKKDRFSAEDLQKE